MVAETLSALEHGCVATASKVEPETINTATLAALAPQPGAGAEQPHEAPEWVQTDSPLFEMKVRSIVAAAAEQFVTDGMAEARANKLAADLAVILPSVFQADFDAYDRLMNSKGAKLDNIAEGFAGAMVEWQLYSADVPELAAGEPVSRRVRYLWNHPGERDVQWEALRPGSLEVGFGLAAASNTPEWPYSGHYSQLSLYAPASGRLMEAEGKRLNRSHDSAWVMLEGCFASGMRTRMKLNFYFDDKADVWFPVTVVFGTDKEHRPFPMQ